MQGPDRDFRGGIGAQAGKLDSEEALEGLLDQIDVAVRKDVERGKGKDPWEDLAAIESWASLASYAAARFYAPASPWRRNFGGWSKRAAARLRSIANALSSVLQPVAKALKAASFSISVSFPWGVSIGLSW
jgi:hypothetical protein